MNEYNSIKEKEMETASDSMQKETVDLSTLSIEGLIDQVNESCTKNNPYAVAKQVEELKSLFYLQLKKENNKWIVGGLYILKNHQPA